MQSVRGSGVHVTHRQGFGADLVLLARLRANQLIEEAGLECQLVGSIHDSIVCDCPTREIQAVAGILKRSIEEVPAYVKRLFGYNFTLPLTCEIGVGPTKADMTEIKV